MNTPHTALWQRTKKQIFLPQFARAHVYQTGTDISLDRRQAQLVYSLRTYTQWWYIKSKTLVIYSYIPIDRYQYKIYHLQTVETRGGFHKFSLQSISIEEMVQIKFHISLLIFILFAHIVCYSNLFCWIWLSILYACLPLESIIFQPIIRNDMKLMFLLK